MFLSGITPGIVNKIGPHNIDLYPNYLWVYTHHHFTASFAQILALLMSYQRRAKLRAFVQRQFTQVVNQALPKLGIVLRQWTQESENQTLVMENCPSTVKSNLCILLSKARWWVPYLFQCSSGHFLWWPGFWHKLMTTTVLSTPKISMNSNKNSYPK